MGNHIDNHIVPNDNIDGAMTSPKSSKPSEDTREQVEAILVELIQLPRGKTIVQSDYTDRIMATVSKEPVPKEDTEGTHFYICAGCGLQPPTTKTCEFGESIDIKLNKMLEVLDEMQGKWKKL